MNVSTMAREILNELYARYSYKEKEKKIRTEPQDIWEKVSQKIDDLKESIQNIPSSIHDAASDSLKKCIDHAFIEVEKRILNLFDVPITSATQAIKSAASKMPVIGGRINTASATKESASIHRFCDRAKTISAHIVLETYKLNMKLKNTKDEKVIKRELGILSAKFQQTLDQEFKLMEGSIGINNDYKDSNDNLQASIQDTLKDIKNQMNGCVESYINRQFEKQHNNEAEHYINSAVQTRALNLEVMEKAEKYFVAAIVAAVLYETLFKSVSYVAGAGLLLAGVSILKTLEHFAVKIVNVKTENEFNNHIKENLSKLDEAIDFLKGTALSLESHKQEKSNSL